MDTTKRISFSSDVDENPKEEVIHSSFTTMTTKETYYSGAPKDTNEETIYSKYDTPIIKKYISLSNTLDADKSTLYESIEKINSDVSENPTIRKIIGIEETKIDGKSTIVLKQEYLDFNFRDLKLEKFQIQKISNFTKNTKSIIQDEKETLPCSAINLEQLIFIIKQILESLTFLQDCQTCHGNLKPENILLTKNLEVKLSDTQINRAVFQNLFSNIEDAVDYPDDFFENENSHVYKAPELILGNPHITVAADMWSLGCVILELIIGKNIFNADCAISTLFKIFQHFGSPTSDFNSELLKLPYYNSAFPLFVYSYDTKDVIEQILTNNSENGIFINSELINLIAGMLEMNSAKRLSPKEALLNPIFKTKQNYK